MPLPSAGGIPPPFPNATPRRLPPPLFALCTRFLAGVFGPYLAIHCRCIVHHWSTVLYAVTGVDLIPVSLREVSVLSEPYIGIARVSPPCLGIRTNEMTGGGDFRRSSLLPSFSGSTLNKLAAAVPWVRVGAEGDHDCMVVRSS